MLNCEESDKEEIDSLCKHNILDGVFWKFGDKASQYLIFKFQNEIIGAVEYKIKDGYLYIEMIQVLRKGFGQKIVRFLQAECPEIRCVPIETSEKLFQKCGFKRESYNSQFWVWRV